MDYETILARLCDEIAVITGLPPEKVDPGAALGDNRIDSMGFIALLVAIRKEWRLDFVSGGLSAADSLSPAALARRIHRDLTGV